jgi:hypothetical protein
MPITYRIDQSLGVVFTTAEGELKKEEALAHQEALNTDGDFDPSYNQIVDVRKTTNIDFSASDLLRFYVTKGFSKESRRAIVVGDQETSAGKQLLAQIVTDFGLDRMKVFSDLETACVWLAER